ncbi:hypothetical protein EVAR_57615_1 [Eumeta japonica]|uniref:Uncharacterized protein n=1 Tax=Eumeta variegata TaxID=151549 RepID=A0A4C1Y151_EUMVA|nr:hypothetical protein EVAR_57615_1 [Eumeta japonica]
MSISSDAVTPAGADGTKVALGGLGAVRTRPENGGGLSHAADEICDSGSLLTYLSDFGAARLDPCELRTVVLYTYTLSERSAGLHSRRSGSPSYESKPLTLGLATSQKPSKFQAYPAAPPHILQAFSCEGSVSKVILSSESRGLLLPAWAHLRTKFEIVLMVTVHFSRFLFATFKLIRNPNLEAVTADSKRSLPHHRVSSSIEYYHKKFISPSSASPVVPSNKLGTFANPKNTLTFLKETTKGGNF